MPRWSPPTQPTVETLDHTPYTMTATYDDSLTPDGSSIVVSDSTGAEVARGTVSPDDDKVMTVDLSSLPPGEYIARWTAVTADDLAVTRGTISFTVAVLATPSPGTTAAPSAAATTSPAGPTPAATSMPSPVPLPSAGGGPPPPTSGSSDVLLALVIAAVVIGGIAVYLFRKSRR